MTQLNVTVTNGENSSVTLYLDLSPAIIGIEDLPDNPGRFKILVPPELTGQGADIAVVKDGYNPIRHRLENNTGQEFDGKNGVPLGIPKSGSWELYSETLVKIFPDIPTREQVCGVQLTAQGLYADVLGYKGFNTIPWFEPGLQCLDTREQRQSVYNSKHNAGDTHLILEFFSNSRIIYDENGQPYQQFVTFDCEHEPDKFLSLVEEVIIEGFIPVIAYDGDDGDNEPFGGPNALRQLPILDSLMQTSQYGDLRPYILFARLWDGVFYGSSPLNIEHFATEFRKLNPNGYLAIEHSTGHIPVGNGPGDYYPGGMMVGYDVIMSEFENWPTVGDAEWQIAGRLLGPDYHRPPEQPSGDDPNPPFYLATGNPRGIYFAIAFEMAIYGWVRNAYNLQQMDDMREYYRKMGYTYIC